MVKGSHNGLAFCRAALRNTDRRPGDPARGAAARRDPDTPLSRFASLPLLALLASCSETPAHPVDLALDHRPVDAPPRLDTVADTAPDRAAADAPLPDAPPGPCPAGMELVGNACLDRYEAPNVAGADPLVMYSFYEAEAWCQQRGKRLCFDDEWTLACATSAGLSYPYGNAHQPGVCNDDKIWKVYSQTKLNGWPSTASAPTVSTLADLLAAASAASAAGQIAADHVQSLYQAEPSGAKQGCRTAQYQVYDLCGNVEEWTRRRDGGGGAELSGNLKGRYWAEARTCQSGVTTHANAFRFYEIGFRCCADPL